MVLLDRGGDDSCYANAVAAHYHRCLGAAAVLYRCAHRFAVLGAQLKNMSNLDSAGNAQCAFATRCWIAFNDVSNVNSLRQIDITAEIDTGVMHISFVGTADKV